METIKNKKVIYFADPFDPPEEEVESMIIHPLERNGIKFHKIICTDIPPWEENYDILFFDWGGMSLGNSMLEHFCKYIIEFAKDYPNRYYIMSSMFTKNAMKDALEYLGDDANLHNIFLDIDSFCEFYKKYELNIGKDI